MIFESLFLLAVIDATLNGPKLFGIRKYLLLGLSLSSVFLSFAFDKGWVAFVFAELCWIIAFVESSYIERTKALEQALQEIVEEQIEVPENTFPAVSYEYMKTCLDHSLKNLENSSENFLGEPWKLVQEGEGVKVYQSKYPGKKPSFFRVECELIGNYETIKNEILNYDARVKWDEAVASGEILKKFAKVDIGEPCITRFITNPAGGGLVSSREVINFGLMVEEVNNNFTFITATIPSSQLSIFPEIPKTVTGVRAITLPGSSLHLKRIEETGKFKFSLINAFDIGGWLPASVVNDATSGVLLSSSQKMIKHLNSLYQK